MSDPTGPLSAEEVARLRERVGEEFDDEIHLSGAEFGRVLDALHDERQAREAAQVDRATAEVDMRHLRNGYDNMHRNVQECVRLAVAAGIPDTGGDFAILRNLASAVASLTESREAERQARERAEREATEERERLRERARIQCERVEAERDAARAALGDRATEIAGNVSERDDGRRQRCEHGRLFLCGACDDARILSHPAVARAKEEARAEGAAARQAAIVAWLRSLPAKAQAQMRDVVYGGLIDAIEAGAPQKERT